MEKNDGRQKKPFWKKWWFWAIVVVAVGVGAAGGSSGGDSEDKNQQEAKQQQVKSTEPESAGEGKNSQEDEPETEEESDGIPTEYKSALRSAETYSEMMHMSKAAIKAQLVSEYGDKFTEEAAQYAIVNLEADWNANALA